MYLVTETLKFFLQLAFSQNHPELLIDMKDSFAYIELPNFISYQVGRDITMEKYFEINAPAVISEPMDDELVVINLDNGCYYNLNKTAASLWKRLEQGYSINEAGIHATRLYGKEEAAMLVDFTDFVELLMKEGLIRAGESRPKNRPQLKEGDSSPYLKPSFEKYSDMQEMLLLDPIHEVSEAGWPHQEKK
jgi:hypothetical protein